MGSLRKARVQKQQEESRQKHLAELEAEKQQKAVPEMPVAKAENPPAVEKKAPEKKSAPKAKASKKKTSLFGSKTGKKEK